MVNKREHERRSSDEMAAQARNPSSSPADALLALQRSAGNQAVAGMLARRTLEQEAALANALGVRKTGDKKLLRPAWDVGLYKPADTPTAPNKLDALRLAAMKSAAVGNGVTSYYTTNKVKLWEGRPDAKFAANTPWNSNPDNRNNAQYPQFDPFLLEVAHKYTKDTQQYDLTLTFQHSDDLSGYVTAITDTGNPAMGGGVSMVDKPEADPDVVAVPTTPLPSGANPVPIGDVTNLVTAASTTYTKYGTSHEEKGSENVLEMTEGASHTNFDAYTKIAGEGSRWQAVRKHAPYLKNTSRFFIKKADDNTKVKYVEFRMLWKAWNTKFKKKYDVPDADIKTYLTAGHKNYVFEADAAAMGNDDYDVDASLPFVELPKAINQ